jgi:membrane protease YdiL (CAAX protease family)
VALVLTLRGDPTPWLSAAPWWSVYGTLIDLGCLLLLLVATRREGLRLADLWNVRRGRIGRDLLLGLGLFALLFPTAIMGGTLLASWLIYGTLQPPVMTAISGRGVLPGWAIVYSLATWWLIWSPTEDMTYAGYTLPRLEAITGRPGLALLLVSFFWAFHHALFPLIPDWRYLLWRFLVFAPVAFAFPWLYRRLGRLLPLTVAHWCMDWLGVVFTLL